MGAGAGAGAAAAGGRSARGDWSSSKDPIEYSCESPGDEEPAAAFFFPAVPRAGSPNPSPLSPPASSSRSSSRSETESASSSKDIASGSFSIPPGPAPLRRTAPGSPRPDAATGLAERAAPPTPAGAFFLPSAFFFGFAAGSSLPSLRPSSS